MKPPTPATPPPESPVHKDWHVSRYLNSNEPLTACIRKWEYHHEGTLNQEQIACLGTIGQLEREFAVCPSYDDTDCQTNTQIRKRYDRAMRYALRADLTDHPMVSYWKTRHEQLHGRGALRGAKMALERRIPRKQLPDEIDAWLHDQIRKGQAAGHSLRAVHRQLGPQKRLPKSFEGFRRYVHRHELFFPSASLVPAPISDQLWHTIERVIMTYDPPSDLTQGGRPRLDARTVLDAIIHKHRTREGWHKLPQQIFPPASSVHQVFRRWCASGLLAHIWGILQATYADLGAIHMRVPRKHHSRSASIRKKQKG